MQSWRPQSGAVEFKRARWSVNISLSLSWTYLFSLLGTWFNNCWSSFGADKESTSGVAQSSRITSDCWYVNFLRKLDSKNLENEDDGFQEVDWATGSNRPWSRLAASSAVLLESFGALTGSTGALIGSIGASIGSIGALVGDEEVSRDLLVVKGTFISIKLGVSSAISDKASRSVFVADSSWIERDSNESNRPERLSIECKILWRVSSSRSLRRFGGELSLCASCDETEFWREDGDRERVLFRDLCFLLDMFSEWKYLKSEKISLERNLLCKNTEE